MWEGNGERGEMFGEGGGGGLNEDGERRWPRIVKEEIERESGKWGGWEGRRPSMMWEQVSRERWRRFIYVWEKKDYNIINRRLTIKENPGKSPTRAWNVVISFPALLKETRLRKTNKRHHYYFTDIRAGTWRKENTTAAPVVLASIITLTKSSKQRGSRSVTAVCACEDTFHCATVRN